MQLLTINQYSAFGYLMLTVAFISVSFLIVRLNIFKQSVGFKFPGSQTHYDSIEGLRGFLALGVYFHHAQVHYNYLNSGVWQVPASDFYLMLGQLGVGYFFIITGFLFTSKIIKNPNLDWNQLYKSRVYRIVPMYVFSTILVLLIVLFKTRFSLNTSFHLIFENAIKWFSFNFFDAPDINGYKNTFTINAWVHWTLKFEWLFYLTLPFLVYLVGKKNNLLIFTILMYLVCLSGNKFLYFFIGGILVAKFIDKPKVFAESIYVGLFLLSLVTLFLAFNNGYGLKQSLIASLSFFALIRSNYLKFLFNSKPINWLGTISYSIYLLHGIFITLGVLVMNAVGIKWGDNFWLITCLIGIATIICSSFTYIFIEKPFILRSRVDKF